MQELNLGALTTSVQKSSSGEGQEANPTTKKKSSNAKSEAYSSSRIQLSEENRDRIDLLRLSDGIDVTSRTQLVNAIIAEYFDEHSENISASIKSLLEKL
ncbi:hypothetical protein [Porphyromonas somerae]|uniref:hypothetical protein n=1 Tax=Porphyromonas somerae TaxID=322095 RepID=UPI002A756294|nr:hypothetical protein [Porphyromonas somerae]MDY3119419.1 hypothetical protein [Porphyromonas somerae]